MATAHVVVGKDAQSATKHGHSTRGGRGKKTPNQQPNMATAQVVVGKDAQSATKHGHSTRGGRGKKTPNQQPNMATAQQFTVHADFLLLLKQLV